MTTAFLPEGLLERAGLSASDVASWAAAAPARGGSFRAAADAVSGFLIRGQALVRRLPGRARRTPDEQAARQAITGIMNDGRNVFLRSHAAGLYDALTDRCTKPLRVEELVYEAAAVVPGLTPTRAEMDAERDRMLAEKEGIEFAQGLLVAYVLALPRPGRHLIGAMLHPVPEAFEHRAELRARGRIDLGPVRITCRGRAGILEMTNPRHLNAEDDQTLGLTECAVGLIRGGVVEHPRYPGVRVFGAGINLTRLYHGRIDYLFYLVRDLGYVNKIYRGIMRAAPDAGAPDRVIEKLWVAAVERYAIGGACQLLHVVDHVIAVRGSRLYLPARKEGIIPGASNLRLPRSVGDRAARQAILSGREWTAGDPDAGLIVDEVVDPEQVEQAIDNRIEALTSSGLVNASANRAAMRVGAEPLDLFREYMATYAREQAYCQLSPALVR